MLEAFLAAARFIHFACLTVLFGVLAFPLYAADHGVSGQGAPDAWRVRLGEAALGTLVGALVSGVLWFLLAAAGMAGDIAAADDPTVLWTAATLTPLGPLWGARLVLLTLTGAVLVWPLPWARRAAPAALSGLLLASLALTGHARAQDGAAGLLHRVADSVHLLGAGAWIGGLVMLSFVLQRDDFVKDARLERALKGFSAMGVAAVAALVATGVVNALFQINRPIELIVTAYGRVLTLKVLLFLGMFALAAVNRLWITPAIADGAADRGRWIGRLRRNVLAEQWLAMAVLLAVSILGVMEPGA